MGNVNEVRAALDSLLSPSIVQLLILNDEPIPDDVEEWFRTWWDEIHPAAAAQGLTLLAIRFGRYDDITAAEYLATSEVGLNRVSPR